MADSHAMTRVEVLRIVRDEHLVQNPEIIETRRAGLEAKIARLRALQTIELLNEEKAGRAVWVPPSRSSSRIGRHGAMSSMESLESKLKAAKTNARLQAGEAKWLSLKMTFMVWRAMSVVRGKMELMLNTIERDDALDTTGKTLAAWRDVAEPWVYDASVLESADLFRLVSLLGKQNRILHYWRELVARRNDLEARREVFEEHLARRIVQDAVIHWKVYRLVYHLKCSRQCMAVQFDRFRRLKAVFVHLRNRARRRMCIRERMEAAVFRCLTPQPTIDDLLSIGERRIVQKDRYVVLDDYLLVKMDVCRNKELLKRLKAAWDDMRHSVRWNQLEGIDKPLTETGANEEKENLNLQVDHAQTGAGDEVQIGEAIQAELASCRERAEDVRLEQRGLLIEITKISEEKLPRLQKKQETAMRNLSECEKVLSDMEVVSQRLKRELLTASEIVSKQEADHAEAAVVVKQLDDVHNSMVASLDAATLQMSSHAEERRKIDGKICHWQAKVCEHTRETNAAVATSSDRKGRAARNVTAAVKLDEARDRLRRVEDRKEELDASYDQVAAKQEAAAVAERHAREELLRAGKIADKAKTALEHAERKYTSLLEQKEQLELDYEGLAPCLEKLLATVDETNAAAAAAFDRTSRLDAQHQALEATLVAISDEMQQLERVVEEDTKLRAAKEAVLDQLVPSISGSPEELAKGENQEVSSTTLWGNESYIHHIFGKMSRRGKPMIPGDRLMLQSADSYHILARSRSCLSRWRRITAQKREARQEANIRFAGHVAPGTFAAWQQHVLEEAKWRETWNECRVLTSSLRAWRRAAQNMRRDALLVESCRAVSATRVQESVLRAWRDITEEELACLDAEYRHNAAIRAKLFLFWRAKAAFNKDLAHRLGPIREKKDAELSRSSFNVWRQATQNRIALRKILDKACSAWSLRLRVDAYFDDSNRLGVLTDCTTAWSIVVHQSREDRRLAAIHEAIETAHHQQLCRTYFRALKNAVQVQKRETATMVESVNERRRMAMLYGAFSHLRSWAAHRAVTSTQLRVKWTYDHPLRNAIVAWQKAIDRRQAMDVRLLLCNKLRRVLTGQAFESVNGGDVITSSDTMSSPIKSATYFAADVTELSFADRSPLSPDVEGTAISL